VAFSAVVRGLVPGDEGDTVEHRYSLGRGSHEWIGAGRAVLRVDVQLVTGGAAGPDDVWPGRSRRLPRTVTVSPGGRRDHVELSIVGRRESFSV